MSQLHTRPVSIDWLLWRVGDGMTWRYLEWHHPVTQHPCQHLWKAPGRLVSTHRSKPYFEFWRA